MKRFIKCIFCLFFISFIKEAYAENDLLFKLGGSERLRLEFRNDFDFNSEIDDKGYLAFQRILINGELKYKENLRLFIEGNDIREISHGLKKTNQSDDFDFYQCYGDWKDEILAVRVGRQEFSYGDKRILSGPTWSNKLKSFDAVRTSLFFKDVTLDTFGGSFVIYDDNNLNDTKAGEYMYGTHFGYKNSDSFIPRIELIYLKTEAIYLKNKLDQHTVDFLMKGPFLTPHINYGFEFAYQFGKYGQDDIEDAYAIHAEISSKLTTFLKPLLKLEYNRASGDKDPHDTKTNTFISLYQSTHEPYGIMDFFRWQNMQEVALSINFNPQKKLSLTSSINCFWLDEKRDSWYRADGSRLRTSVNPDVDDFIGKEISLVLKYILNQNMEFEMGCAHFFTSSYVDDTGPDDDSTWGYFQTRLRF